MDHSMIEKDRALDRRAALRALLGLAAVTMGATALLIPGKAEAAPATAPAIPEAPKFDPVAEPAADMARDEDLPAAELTYHRYWHRPYRRRVVVYRRPRRVYRRRVYYRRRYY
jgi:hypothetical protein